MAVPTVIIGAGVGGLTTGAILANNGHKVMVLEKSGKLGGRTTSMEYKNHILDNGFHIMPFYKKSAIFTILKNLGIESRLKLAKVDDIAFYADTGFHIYPKGMMDLLKLSLIPFKSRVRLLKLLLPLAFSSIEKTELWDGVPLTKITNNLDSDTQKLVGNFRSPILKNSFVRFYDILSFKGQEAEFIISIDWYSDQPDKNLKNIFYSMLTRSKHSVYVVTSNKEQYLKTMVGNA